MLFLHYYFVVLLDVKVYFNDRLKIFMLLQVLRYGKLTEEEAAILVPKDTTSNKLDDIIPIDVNLIESL